MCPALSPRYTNRSKGVIAMNTTTITNATEYRNLPLALLTESKTNPRRTFENDSLKELAESIRTQGILSPLLVRPIIEQGFEIVFGARRYRAAQMADASTVPVRIKNLTDAEALEAQLIENLQRRDVHPMEEANGFRALLNLEEPKYSIEQIAARTGKSPAYVAGRLKLTELAPVVVEAFYREEIGVGTLAPTQIATTQRSMPMLPRPLRRSPSSCKSAWPTASSRKAARRCRVTSTPKSGQRSPRPKKRLCARSSKPANTPQKPSCRTASTRAKSARFARRLTAGALSQETPAADRG
jgi:ParB/RepB/Spo0J family partition protein